jgi:hypothetical protein
MMNTDSMINVLQASGPHPDQALQLMLFGQFVGAWDVDITTIAPDGTKKEIKGEWHFGWVLEGRAIGDVWIAPRRSLRSSAEHYDYGATLRFFDPTIQAWRVTWIGPERHVVLPFIGRQVGDEIILEGSFAEREQTCWIFSDITATSFHWRAMESNDGGVTWTKVMEMVGRRAVAD